MIMSTSLEVSPKVVSTPSFLEIRVKWNRAEPALGKERLADLSTFLHVLLTLHLSSPERTHSYPR